MTDWLDKDIKNLHLSDEEKNGLQVYRNYQKAFWERSEVEFAREVDSATNRTAELEKVLTLVVEEDTRFLPVVLSAFADELLEQMFKENLSDGLVGKKADLFGPYGPLSNYSSRLQLASAFGMISQDLAKDLDKIRKVRNKISHSWDLEEFKTLVKNDFLSSLTPIEKFLQDDERTKSRFEELTDEPSKFKIRLAWIASRIYYETCFFYKARKKGLEPGNALYGPNRPKFLGKISALALATSKRLHLQGE